MIATFLMSVTVKLSDFGNISYSNSLCFAICYRKVMETGVSLNLFV